MFEVQSLLAGSLALTHAEVEASGISAALDGKRPAQTPKVAASGTLSWKPRANWLFAATLRELQSYGHKVVVVQTLPHFGEVDPWMHDTYQWDPAQCTFGVGASVPCLEDMPLSHADRVQEASRAVIAATAETLGVKLVDLRNEVCPSGTCSTWRDGRLIYRDAAHISVVESQSLADAWLPVLKAG